MKKLSRIPADKVVSSPKSPSIRKARLNRSPKKSDSSEVESLNAVSPFPIVGIGASAGGLEAFSDLLQALPINTGMAFILVQHLDPTHGSLASEILSRTTRMSVLEVKDGASVEPNTIYIIPPNSELAILHGILSLLPRRRGPRGQQTVIDSFLQSLAEDQRGRAIGVILSGTASDGTQGLKAIKSNGGLTLAQDPKSAKYKSMPESAIAAGAVDLILSPKKIARELTRIAMHPYYVATACELPTQADSEPDHRAESLETETDDALREIFACLRKFTHVDFSNYKPTTIKRRIQRRMVVRKSESIEAYSKYLQDNPEEVKALHADILIHVTEFFRDPDSFKALNDKVIPLLVKNRTTETPIRVWVPGCSTGEEAYSLAITLIEFLDKKAIRIPIQIFATDISEQAIQKARTGIYSEGVGRAVSKERLSRFFEKVSGGYKVKKALRHICLFSVHDVTIDPPFSKLDLVSCRNVLIYFTTILQRRVIPTFHYALNPSRFLWLGVSEGPGGFSKLFAVVDKAHKIFSKVNISTPMPLRPSLNRIGLDFPLVKPGRAMNGDDYQKDADRVAFARYLPPSIIVSADLEILKFQGRTGPYLDPAAGAPSNALFRMVRPELLSDVRTAVKSAIKNNSSARAEGISFEVDGKLRQVSIEVVPVNPLNLPKQRSFVIFFEEESAISSKHSVKSSARMRINKEKGGGGTRNEQDRLSRQFAEALSAEKHSRQLMMEEFEAGQEELTSANEELQSTNEELQSTNEELETAKEELQSSNEELNTVNDELQNRNAELTALSSDLSNVLNNVNSPIVIVGTDRRIRKFTSKAEEIFNLITGDVGRPLTDIKPNFEMDLDRMVMDVARSLTPQEKDVQIANGPWMRVQVRPYKAIDNRIDGAVISLVDISTLKESLDASQSELKYASSVADTLRLPLVVLDEYMRLMSANKGFANMFQLVPNRDIGSDLMSLLGGKGWNVPHLQERLIKVITENQELTDFEVEHDFPKIGKRSLLLNARQITWQNEMPKALLLSIDDVTERRRLERDLEQSNQVKDDFLAILSHELRTPLTTILGWAEELVSSQKDAETVKNGLSIIAQSARIQGQLIDDLLDISRIRTGKLSIEIGVVDPAKVLSLAVNSIRTLAEKKSISVQVDPTPSNCIILADATRVQQIFWNLLTNAIKFTPGGGRVFVKLDVIESSAERWAQVQVSDSGMGIKPDFLPHIFKRFSQEDSSMTRQIGGLGLGLALVKSLVEMQGGTVEAESPGEGKGATFTVKLPIAPTDKMQIRPAHLPGEAQRALPRLNGVCILVVDDDVFNRELFDMMLTSGGAEVRLAQSAAEARQILAEFKPDILISDISMPIEDGYTFIRKIRRLDAGHGGNIPAIALTAHATADDVRRVIDAGFSAHVAKPVEKATLFQAIARLISPGR